MKHTPLYDKHVGLGARMVSFAGYEMPVSYSGIIEEHEAVRQRVGIFDVSHMGEFVVSGAKTFEYLDRVMTNHCAKLPSDGVLYTVMCRENGTTVDDVLVMRLAEDRALVVVNAANIEKDFAHMQSLLIDGVELDDISESLALIAVQGPNSADVLARMDEFAGARKQFQETGYYRHFTVGCDGSEVIVSRTGYTGELGFEVFLPARLASRFWDGLLEKGADCGIMPVGLAARDTLRFEAAFCLYGHELDDETSPLEAGLQWVVKFRKGDFCGRAALVREKELGSKRRLAGFELEGRNIARDGYPVTRGGAVVGRVTSGTFSPSLKKSLCLAYVDSDAATGSDFSVQVRNKEIKAAPVELPFYASRARER